MKTRFGKKIVALAGAIAVVLSLLPSALPVMAESSGDEPAAQNAANAPLIAQSGTATPENALSDEAYKDFGFRSLPDQEAFTSDEQPLEGFEGATMSRLFVGYMNKSKSQQGNYAVYDTMNIRSGQGATISGSGLAGYLDASPVSAPAEYTALQLDNFKYRTLNSVSLDMGTNADGTGGKPPVICEAVLLTGKEKGVANAKNTSWLCVITLEKNGNGYVPKSTDYTKLATSNTRIGEIDVRAAQGLNAVAAGDFDGDGADELAVYVPQFDRPYIQIYDIGEDGSIAKSASFPLNDLHTENDWGQYSFEFSGWNLPIVNLSISGLARAEGGRKEHLVVSACLPRSTAKPYKGHSQLPALAVYEQDGPTMKRLFLDHLDYGDYYMRFPAAVEADVNGNGTGELVVAGYADTWTDTNNQTLKDHPFEKYCVNLLTWDKDANTYRMAYTKPMEFTPTGSVKKAMESDNAYAMSEPVALAAADLSEVTDSDYLLLEGAVLSFSAINDAKKTDSEQMQLAGGKLTGIFELNMNPQAVTVSHAVSGRFAGDRPRSEQIALVWNDNYSHPNAVVDSNITWLWMENNVVTQHDTNYQYLKGRDANGNGTFLSLAQVEDTEHRVTYKYTGKSYGWSAPNALIALPAVPYWKELPYENGVGDVSFSVGSDLKGSAGVGMDVSLGVTGSVSAMAGAGALGNKAIGGFSVDFDASVAVAAQLQGGLSAGNTQTYSAPGDKNHVLVYATPMVTYQYKVWLPAFQVTEETREKYRELTNSDTLKNEDGTVYKVGDTVPAGWYSYNLHVPYSPTYSLITMDQYNEAYTKHNLGTGKIDMSAYDFTVGDPTTYKSSFSDIPHYNSEMHMQSRPKDIMANGVTNTIEFDAGASITGSGSITTQFSGAVQGKIEAEVNFFGAGKLEVSEGLTGSIAGSITGEVGFDFSIGAGASINPLPTGNGGYDFQTTMGVWPCVGHGALLTTGFIVAEKPDAPPKPPENPYVYETGMQNNGKAFLVLAWDAPTDSDTRLASGYEVLYKNTGASVSDYRKLGQVGALEQNFMVVTDLTPDKTYDFAFRPLLPNGQIGGFSSPLTATTAGAATLSVDPTTPADLYETPNAQGVISCNFTVSASDSDTNNTIEYRWQKYEIGEGYIGEWVDLNMYTSSIVESLSTGDDGAKYRCVVSSRVNKPFQYSAETQTVISRVSTVHVGTDPRFSVALSAQAAGGAELPRERGGAYFLPAGSQVTLKAEVTKKDVTGISDGTISLFCRKDGGAETLITSGLTPVNGIVTHEWTPAESGGYDLVAVYTGPVTPITNSAPENTATEPTTSPAEPTAGPTGEPATSPAPTQSPAATPTDEPTTMPEPAVTTTPEPTAPTAPDPSVEPAGENTAGPASLHAPEIEPPALSATGNPPEPTTAATMPEPSATATPEATATPAEAPAPTQTETASPQPTQTASPEPTATPTSEPSETAAADPVLSGIDTADSARSAANTAVSAPIAIHVGLIKDEGYLVRYELDGGTNSVANPNAIGRNAAPTALAAPTRVGATFEGWYDDAAFKQKIEYVDPMRIAQKLAGGSGPYVLYAKWTATEYGITYELESGANHPDNPDKYNLLDGAALREPEKTGYRFMGWYYDGAADVDNTKPVSSLPLLDKKGDWVAADVTLRAKWEAIEYPITYHTPFAAGKGNNPDTYTVEDAVTLNIADYTGRLINFGGWYTDAEYTTPITEIAAGATGPLSLYAKPEIYLAMLSFHTLGGVYGGQNPMMVNIGSGGVQLGDASRQGFDFKTWCEQAKTVDGELVADDSDPGKTHDVFTPYNPPAIYNVLYAAWTPAAGQVELHWLDPLDGEEVYLNHGVMGQTIADPGIAPDHYGYAFDGKWYKDEALTRQWDFSSDTVPTNLTGGLTLYAGLRKAYCTVSFETNGGTAIPAQQVQEGKTVAKPADPALQDKMFLGWYEDDALSIPYDFSCEVQSNLTLYAKWRSRGPVRPGPGDSKILGIEDAPEPTPTPGGKEPTPTPTGGATPAPGGPTPEAPAPTDRASGGGGPKTGGDSNIHLFIVLALVAAAAIVAVLVAKSRHSRGAKK